MTNPKVSSYASQLLQEAREEVTRADGKASILLAAAGIAVSVIAGSSMINRAHGRINTLFIIFDFLGIIVGLIGILFLALAVMPRTKHSGEPKNVSYFGHVATFTTSKTLVEAIELVCEQDEDRIVDQLLTISQIVVKKYSFIKNGLIALGSSILLLLIASVVEIVK